MMTALNSQILDIYEAIERASEAMLTAARASNWDEVIRLEGVCVCLITKLHQTTRQTQLSSDEQVAKHGIMQRILVNDAEIRHLADPWLELIPGENSPLSKAIH